MTKLSPNADKALVLLYVGTRGWDHAKSPNPVWALARIAGISEEEARAAFLECERRGLVERSS